MRALEHIVAASSGAAEEITGGGIERLAAQAGASDADAVNAERAHVAQMRHALAMKQGKIDELAARVAAQSTEVSPSRPGSAARWKSKARELATALKMSRALLRTRDVATPSSAGAASTPARATALLATPAAAPGSAAGVSESARGSHSVPAADVDALRAEITASVKAAYKLRFATKIVGAIEKVRAEERVAAAAALDKQRAEWGLQVSSMQEAGEVRDAARVAGSDAGSNAGSDAGSDAGADADANAGTEYDATASAAVPGKPPADAAVALEALTAHAITMFDSHRRRHETRNCFRSWRHVLEIKAHRRDAREQQHYLLLEKERRRAETAPLERQIAAMKRREEVQLALSKWKTHMAFGEEKSDRRVTAVRKAARPAAGVYHDATRSEICFVLFCLFHFVLFCFRNATHAARHACFRDLAVSSSPSALSHPPSRRRALHSLFISFVCFFCNSFVCILLFALTARVSFVELHRARRLASVPAQRRARPRELEATRPGNGRRAAAVLAGTRAARRRRSRAHRARARYDRCATCRGGRGGRRGGCTG